MKSHLCFVFGSISFLKKNFSFRGYTHVGAVTLMSKTDNVSILKIENGHMCYTRVADFDSENRHFAQTLGTLGAALL